MRIAGCDVIVERRCARRANPLAGRSVGVTLLEIQVARRGKTFEIVQKHSGIRLRGRCLLDKSYSVILLADLLLAEELVGKRGVVNRADVPRQPRLAEPLR